MWVLVFVLSSVACSHPAGLRTDEASNKAEQRQVPFQGGQEGTSPASTAGLPSPGLADGAKPDSSLPFGDSQGLPAGTLLTVRLKNPISTDDSGFTATFDAVVDEPVLIEGNLLLPRGAAVAGRVESARTSQLKRNRGYVRLTLASIDIGGRGMPIQTSSLFVKGSPSQTQSAEGGTFLQGLHLESGRRLTFRLNEPLSLSGQAPMSAR